MEAFLGQFDHNNYITFSLFFQWYSDYAQLSRWRLVPQGVKVGQGGVKIRLESSFSDRRSQGDTEIWA
jgi:hypothetical protein